MTLNRKDGALALVMVLFVAAGIAVAAGIGGQKLTTDSAMDRAGTAALAATGGGRVTESEVSDDKQGYEIEVTLDNGNRVDVRLDTNFKVISQSANDNNDERERDDGPDVH